MLYIRPDPGLTAQECNLRVSIQPLRLNVDQVMPGDFLIALMFTLSVRRINERGSNIDLSNPKPRRYF